MDIVNDQQKWAFMESAFSPGWPGRLKMIMPETQLSVPFDEYVKSINWNALKFTTNREKSKSPVPVNMPQPRLANSPHQLNSLIPVNRTRSANSPSLQPPFPPISAANRPRSANSSNLHPPSPIPATNRPRSTNSPNHNWHPGVLGNDKYKTSLCKSYAINGTCNYGASCLFAHGPSELRSFHQNISAATRAINGGGGGHPHHHHNVFYKNSNNANKRPSA